MILTTIANNSLDIDGFKDYKGMLYYTTLGSIEQGVTKCAKASVGDQLSFSCEKGTLGSFSTFQYGRIYPDETDTSCELITIVKNNFFQWN